MIHVRTARVILVEFAKWCPFVLCALVCLSHVESYIALKNEDFIIDGDGSTILNKPISFFIGDILEYDWLAIIICGILAMALETCIWNKLTVIYLGINFLERYKFGQIELTPEQIDIICAVNVLVSAFLTYKGISKLLYHARIHTS
jgi:hypothetical protein